MTYKLAGEGGISYNVQKCKISLKENFEFSRIRKILYVWYSEIIFSNLTISFDRTFFAFWISCSANLPSKLYQDQMGFRSLFWWFPSYFSTKSLAIFLILLALTLYKPAGLITSSISFTFAFVTSSIQLNLSANLSVAVFTFFQYVRWERIMPTNVSNGVYLPHHSLISYFSDRIFTIF